MSEEQRINVCKTSLNQILTSLQENPRKWRNHVPLARTIIAHLNATSLMQHPDRLQERIWLVGGLQKLANTDPDSGELPDVAAWCTQQWAKVQQTQPNNIAALRGLGQAWLARAQPALSRIQREEGRSASDGTPQSRSGSASSQTEAEKRTGTAQYVEARGSLQPAIDYLERAIAAATSQRLLTGDLLATTAEAYMSLGNVSSPRSNQQQFTRALQLLRAANSIDGYKLNRYLQQYLEKYGRYIDD
ncbi:hypothetical protein CERZMDRAFT_92520 [Cercospora zeae-maydis SCOH1-5]|uniref:Uncharacterized protein n=1 Tax=Cercospora zeae-maydis SCOH1-5 TaxID=717836 RepID=A0A6A6FXD6_9PEZI|nr:hypothetical protein CERZMDRAFT_92520 [Cercospora zeae-maydis SCOH1-5]